MYEVAAYPPPAQTQTETQRNVQKSKHKDTQTDLVRRHTDKHKYLNELLAASFSFVTAENIFVQTNLRIYKSNLNIFLSAIQRTR